MVIGFNAKAAFTKNRTGVDEYVFWLIKTLIKYPLKGVKFIFYTDYLPKDKTLYDFFGVPIPKFIEIKVLQSKYLWTQGRLAIELLKNPVDVFFTPTHVLPLFAPKKSIVTIHDLAYEYYPELYNPFSPFGLHYLRFVTKYAVKKASKIIAVSENTKQDLIKLYQVNPSKIFVIYHGVPQLKNINKESEDIKPLKLDTTPYILFLGRIELKKNLKNLILAFNLLNDKLISLKFNPVKLVLGGLPGYGYLKILKVIQQSPYRDKIILTGHLQGGQKEQILKKASLLALVSYYEGFGLPIVEAQNAGVPVVCSSVASLPEIAGRGALFCPVNDIEAMQDCFFKILTDENTKNRLVKYGFENAKNFSWEKCINETLNVLLN